MSAESIAWLNNNTLIGFTGVRGNAWHYSEESQGELSNHFEGAIPADEVRARLFGFELVEAGAQFVMPDGSVVTDSNRIGVIRSDTRDVLGTFKSSYEIHQYDEWLINNVETLLDDGDLTIGSAGLLRNGAQAWVEVGVPELQTVGGFEYRVGLLAATSCDGSLATQYRTEVSATVCDNTLRMATKVGRGVKIKHTRNSGIKIQSTREALDLIETLSNEFSLYADNLMHTKVTDDQWRAFLDAYVPVPDDEGRGRTMGLNKREALDGFFFANNMVKEWTGTAFGVLHAVNTYEHHGAIVRGVSRAERNYSRMVTGGSDVDRNVLDTLNLVIA